MAHLDCVQIPTNQQLYPYLCPNIEWIIAVVSVIILRDKESLISRQMGTSGQEWEI